MKYKIIAFAIAATMPPHISNALSIAGNCSVVSCPGNEVQTFNSCGFDSYTSKCYKTSSGTVYKVFNCNSCSSGTATNVAISELIKECSTVANTVTQCCTSCTNCVSDTTYSAIGTAGYEQHIARKCTCYGGCESTYSYRCAAGYYGTSTNGKTGCTRCPPSDGAYGKSAAGSKFITSCYIPAGTTITNTGGTFTYTENCSYSSDTSIGGGDLVINPGELIKP